MSSDLYSRDRITGRHFDDYYARLQARIKKDYEPKKKTLQARIKQIMNKWPSRTFEVGAALFMNRVHEERERGG